MGWGPTLSRVHLRGEPQVVYFGGHRVGTGGDEAMVTVIMTREETVFRSLVLALRSGDFFNDVLH